MQVLRLSMPVSNESPIPLGQAIPSQLTSLQFLVDLDDFMWFQVIYWPIRVILCGWVILSDFGVILGEIGWYRVHSGPFHSDESA